MEQEHTKPTSNWQEIWQILRHGQLRHSCKRLFLCCRTACQLLPEYILGLSFVESAVPSGGISRIRRNRRGGTSADDRHYKGQRDNTWKYHQCLSDDRKSSFHYGGIPVEYLRTEVSLVFEKRSLTG